MKDFHKKPPMKNTFILYDISRIYGLNQAVKFKEILINLNEKHDIKELIAHLGDFIQIAEADFAVKQENYIKIYLYGKKKYKEMSYLSVNPHLLIDAFLRHSVKALTAEKPGDNLDEETGEPHIWHALTNLRMLYSILLTCSKVELENYKKEYEDFLLTFE